MNSECLMLTKEQNSFIYEKLDLFERFNENIIKYGWFIEKIDWKENYCRGKNIYPYAIWCRMHLQEILIDCIGSNFLEQIKQVR